MKKLTTMALIAFLAIGVIIMIMPQTSEAAVVSSETQEQDLLPVACTAAEEHNWESWGWNAMCLAYMQLEGQEWEWDFVQGPAENVEETTIIEVDDAGDTVTTYHLRA
ncbi:hypothetical protein KKH39_03510 [Patescibacteria group bacterium]|nr:hypothetical protein [Patescibacteria group bacterium]